jgi:hypothetical protein
VWGKGVIAARKVRLLHAAMRCMLLNPAKALPAGAHKSAVFANSSIGALTAELAEKPYDYKNLGKPVNQEDLAYTLLTFGYAIPVGLRAWGCRLSDDDCDAFLHSWRLVGHIMGVREELIPKDFTQAERFYTTVKRRQAGSCRQGPVLMKTLVGFLQDYLPGFMRRDLPMMLVATQLTKAEVALITPKDAIAPAWYMRLIMGIGMPLLRCYYAVKTLLVQQFPPLRVLLGRSFAIAGQALIDSWRDGYERRPFYIPSSIAGGGWQREKGMDERTRTALSAWRVRLFRTVIVGVTLLVAAALLTVISLVTIPFFIDDPRWLLAPPLTMLICWVAGFSILTW